MANSLKKSLTLYDVFAISTGAMFSSGFFLLPGIAASQTGPSVILAYFVAGIMIIPAMLSKAELTSAMPKAGGSYYFIERAMGPLMGTIGGLGTWLSLVFKTAFALIGMGAYLAIFVELPVKPLAIAVATIAPAEEPPSGVFGVSTPRRCSSTGRSSRCSPSAARASCALRARWRCRAWWTGRSAPHCFMARAGGATRRSRAPRRRPA